MEETISRYRSDKTLVAMNAAKKAHIINCLSEYSIIHRLTTSRIIEKKSTPEYSLDMDIDHIPIVIAEYIHIREIKKLRIHAHNERKELINFCPPFVLTHYQILFFPPWYPRTGSGSLTRHGSEPDPVIESGAAVPGHSFANHGVALPVAERTDGAVFRHAQADARPHRH